jgi:hypothetical protein
VYSSGRRGDAVLLNEIAEQSAYPPPEDGRRVLLFSRLKRVKKRKVSLK